MNNLNKLINNQLSQNPTLSSILDIESNQEFADGCIRLSLEDALRLDSSFIHVAHCFLFTGSNSRPESMYGIMQMRTDGRIGFTGGGVEGFCPTASQIVDAVNREIHEEINYDSANVTLKHYVSSHLHLRKNGKRIVSHFFIKKVPSMNEFKQIEKNHTEASDFPEETLGIFRVPIYPQEARFLDSFSKHFFAGDAREQLFEALDAIRNGKDQDWE